MSNGMILWTKITSSFCCTSWITWSEQLHIFTLLRVEKPFIASSNKIYLNYSNKHCLRHNGPEGWVLPTKVTYFSHITRSNTIFDQISSPEYWPSTNFNILTSANISTSSKLKIQDIDQTWLRNLAWTSTSKYWPNLVIKVWTKV